ncbi:uncharacterized protein BO97DRAFT_449361 [Aspergillus homomorphus CBS 101889]|uniref:BTB domain-containing protein n=1 Tax=Aspergillus homomorphus (strain CBS 101889) TaxID=1450537 RepID=A0A395I1X1_ASPHC|nr:hypothetical protein BO97DRAFT_449361 [Aspergillus homomorphus CBS 101889]RAL13927.1 hypothetical protein BO97DRAFT_449361 [Aspergillus homomorphus CBS 101889]
MFTAGPVYWNLEPLSHFPYDETPTAYLSDRNDVPIKSGRVKLTVGPNRAVFMVDTGHLRDHSTYFRNLSDPMPNQDFPADYSELFRNLIKWLYMGAARDFLPLYGELFMVKLCGLARRLGVDDLVEDIMNNLDTDI